MTSKSTLTLLFVQLLVVQYGAANISNVGLLARQSSSEVDSGFPGLDNVNPALVQAMQSLEACQDTCSAQVDCEPSDSLTSCFCTNEITSEVADCINCAMANSQNVTQEDGQQLMDSYVSACQKLGSNVDSQQITGDENGAGMKMFSVVGGSLLVFAMTAFLL
ncbi:hypothetical protein VKT23_007776 [Stygiomarasmius scandens]|uniref:Uncharacterized protein n=1 Tax=Marasmiellus scandens TaxID=2682957 RepID=A0ABR1JMM2_9AGAR